MYTFMLELNKTSTSSVQDACHGKMLFCWVDGAQKSPPSFISSPKEIGHV